MTRVSELDSRMTTVESEIEKLQKGQEEIRELGKETNRRVESIETNLTMLTDQLIRIAAQIETRLQRGLSPNPGGVGASNSKAPMEETPPMVIRSAEHTSVESKHVPSPLVARKVELPMFDGEDPLTWISKAEQYFAIQSTKPPDRVTVAMVSMDGAALNWVRWISQQRPSFVWDELKAELVKRFLGTQASNRFEHLSLLRQTSMVDEFVDEIVACAAHTTGLGNDQLLGYFLAGLKPQIRVDLHRFEETELFAAMDGARRVERKLNFEQGLGRGPWKRELSGIGSGQKSWPNKSPTGSQSSSSGGSGPKGSYSFNRPRSEWGANPASSGSVQSTAAKPRFTRSISPRELSDLRAKGLCFKCQQPYSPLHRCGEKVFKLIEFREEELNDTDVEVELIQIGEDGLRGEKLGAEPDLQWLELPLNALGGTCNPRALKIRAKLGERKVVVLVNSGTSHNFVNQCIVEVEEIPVEQTGTFGVRLGNGHKVETRGICKELPLQFGSCEMNVDCYPDRTHSSKYLT